MTMYALTSKQRSSTRWSRPRCHGCARALGEVLRRTREDDSGFTLIELALSMIIMAVVLALFVPTLLVLINGESSVGALADVNVKIQPALELLQNQVNSATRLFDPIGDTTSWHCTGTTTHTSRGCSTPVQPGFALLMLTVSADSVNECVQWRVHTTRRITTPTTHSKYPPQLQYRTWPASSSTTPSLAVPFRNAAQGVSIANTTSSRHIQEPFKLAGSGTPQQKEVVVTLWLSPSKKASRLQLRTIDAEQGVGGATITPAACTVPPAQ